MTDLTKRQREVLKFIQVTHALLVRVLPAILRFGPAYQHEQNRRNAPLHRD